MGVKRRSVWLASKRAMSGIDFKPAFRIRRFLICLNLLCAATICVCATTARTFTRTTNSTGMNSAAASTAAKLTFRRVFKESTPEFIEIVVTQDSDKGTYEIRQLDEDPEKLPFEVSAVLRAKMFELAGQMNHFQGQDLDVHRKIANLGRRRFGGSRGRKRTKLNSITR